MSSGWIGVGRGKTTEKICLVASVTVPCLQVFIEIVRCFSSCFFARCFDISAFCIVARR